MPDCITITARENPVRLNSKLSRVINRKMPRALVAQLDRVLASEAKGRGFDSRRARHFLYNSGDSIPIHSYVDIISTSANLHGGKQWPG